MQSLSNISNNVATYYEQLQAVIADLDAKKIARVIEVLLEANERGSTIFLFGNGGSAATATHFANDLAKGCLVEGCNRLRAISLTDNVALITALANDTGYENIFSSQLESLICSGDIVIGISGSGNSPNVLKGMQVAREAGAYTIGFCGFGGGKLRGMVDLDLTSGCLNMQQVEDLHMTLCHCIATGIVQALSNTQSQLFLPVRLPQTKKTGSNQPVVI